MATFEGSIFVSAEPFDTPLRPTTAKDHVYSTVHKVADGQINLMATCDDGTVEIRLGWHPDHGYALDVWVTPDRTQHTHQVNRKIYSGTVKEFCSGREILVHIAARTMLEDAYDKTA